MTDLRNQRRMAAQLLKCGEKRVWLDLDRADEIAKAVTKDDIRVLIEGEAIKKKQKQGVSRGRGRHLAEQKKKGRRTGAGKRKGAKYARLPHKERWMTTIRALRRYLKKLRDEGKIDRSVYRQYYRKAKGGEFRSKNHLKTRLEAEDLIKEEDKEEK
ncbi:MAG: 50S ribosomal protein L19e [Candidatus Thermoplasmatota archaeon]